MNPAQKEFVMLWALLTATAATNTDYSAAQHGNTVDSIIFAIERDVVALGHAGWNFPNLTEGVARQVISEALATQQSNGAFFAVNQDFFTLLNAGTLPWTGGGSVHPSVPELLAGLGLP